MEWPWLIYRLPKPTHNTGQTFVQLEPLDFINRIAAFIPRRAGIGITIMEYLPRMPLKEP